MFTIWLLLIYNYITKVQLRHQADFSHDFVRK
jgi:hypothetical protein